MVISTPTVLLMMLISVVADWRERRLMRNEGMQELIIIVLIIYLSHLVIFENIHYLP